MLPYYLTDADGLVKRCPAHPTYSGKNKPRTGKDGTVCEECNRVHAIYHQKVYRRKILVNLTQEAQDMGLDF